MCLDICRLLKNEIEWLDILYNVHKHESIKVNFWKAVFVALAGPKRCGNSIY